VSARELPTNRILAMHFAGTNGSADPISHMTSEQLRRLGMPWLVYLRSGRINGEVAYAIHAADGTPIAVVEDVEVALDLASANDLTFARVH
jgi:hypothetical protein